MTPTALERPKSLTDMVYDRLLLSITSGQIPFGHMLSEKALANDFGISKTPVREAFVHLQSMGLVDVIPQKGCLVFQPTIKQVEDLCEARIVLESAAFRFAMSESGEAFITELQEAHSIAEHCSKTSEISEYNLYDEKLHRTMFKHCNNEMLVSAYEVFQPRIQTLRVNLQTTNGYLVDVSTSDHGEIARRAAVGDIDGAVEMIALHVRRMKDVYASNWVNLMERKEGLPEGRGV